MRRPAVPASSLTAVRGPRWSARNAARAYSRYTGSSAQVEGQAGQGLKPYRSYLLNLLSS